MYAAEAKQISLFCDDTTHNRYAPTKHNQMCNRRSTLDVISSHRDFKGVQNFRDDHYEHISTTVPKFQYKRREMTRYVVVVDETSDMTIRDSWTFLKTAIRKWVVYDLPKTSTEIGIVLTNGSDSDKIEPIAPLRETGTDDRIVSTIPFSAASSGCLSCAIKRSIEMLKERTRLFGPANSVVLVIAPGMDKSTDPQLISSMAREALVKIVTINYPGIVGRQPLDELAYSTQGTPFTVYEKKYNGEKTYLTTYFELSNILMHIGHLYYEGNRADLPMEIHRKEIVDIADEGTNKVRSVANSFTLDGTISTANFFVYTNNENVLFRSMELASPNGTRSSKHSESRLNVKQLMSQANITETGSWSYKIERENGNPQPDYVQVLAKPKSADHPVLTARSWVKRSRNSGPIAFYVEVKRGLIPVEAAQVMMTVTRPDIICNQTSNCAEEYRLFDTGSGDPDVTKGDGIYSRYFSAAYSGPGAYRFEILVTDNGQTAYSLNEDKIFDNQGYRCCGSHVPLSSKKTLPPFQRHLPPITLFITQEQIEKEKTVHVGKIGDLRAQRRDGNKYALIWTAPDMGTPNVDPRTQVKYASKIEEIVDDFETAAVEWTHSQALAYAAGHESTLIINLDDEPDLIGQTVYFAVRTYSSLTQDAIPGPVSNYVLVYVPRIPVTVKPYRHDEERVGHEFPDQEANEEQYDGAGVFIPSTNFLGFRPEYVLAGAIVAVVLFFIFSIYCYFCISKRRPQDQNDPKKTMKSKMLNDAGKQPQINVIIPQSPGHNHNGTYQTQGLSPQHQIHPQQTSTPSYPMDNHGQMNGNHYLIDVPDHHTIGLPIYQVTEEDLQKPQYTIVEHQEKQLIEELKQQQQFQAQQQLIIGEMMDHCNLSIISSSNPTLTRNGRILSPYESWTASQLLHEHERRHSPLDDGALLYNHQEQLPPVPPLPYQQIDQQILVGTDNYIYTSTEHMPPPQYSTIQRNQQNQNQNSNPSSATSSQNGGDKKRRNVTMV
jgi:hypothetical protein